MHTRRAPRPLTHWIAILAVLLASLAPAVSQALGASAGASWFEVCTTQGAKWVQADGDDAERAPAMAHVFEHCPYCSLHTPALGLPPQADKVPLASSLAHHPVPRAFLAAPGRLHAWASAQPRAPPL